MPWMRAWPPCWPPPSREHDHFGLGGEMPILIKMNGKPVVAISGVGVAPGKPRSISYAPASRSRGKTRPAMPPIPAQGILAATVPGVFDGLMLALEKYGTKSSRRWSRRRIELCATASPRRKSSPRFIRRPASSILDLWPASRAFFMPERHAAEPRRVVPRAHSCATRCENWCRRRRRRTAIARRRSRRSAITSIRARSRKRIGDFSAKNGGLITLRRSGEVPRRNRQAPHHHVPRLRKSTSRASGRRAR